MPPHTCYRLSIYVSWMLRFRYHDPYMYGSYNPYITSIMSGSHNLYMYGSWYLVTIRYVMRSFSASWWSNLWIPTISNGTLLIGVICMSWSCNLYNVNNTIRAQWDWRITISLVHGQYDCDDLCVKSHEISIPIMAQYTNDAIYIPRSCDRYKRHSDSYNAHHMICPICVSWRIWSLHRRFDARGPYAICMPSADVIPNVLIIQQLVALFMHHACVYNPMHLG